MKCREIRKPFRVDCCQKIHISWCNRVRLRLILYFNSDNILNTDKPILPDGMTDYMRIVHS